MRLQNSIICSRNIAVWRLGDGTTGRNIKMILFFASLLLCVFALQIFPQKIAIITPEQNLNSDKIAVQISEKLNAMDSDLVRMAVKSQSIENFYNLTTDEAKNLGKIIGCDFFIILKTGNIRRTSFDKPVYFESFATIYLVSAKTGNLLFWTLKSFESDNQSSADTQLFSSIDLLTNQLRTEIKNAQVSELNHSTPPDLEELPAENSPEAKNFKLPLPFKRYVPVYKRLANLYAIAATVEATVDLDENGKITRIEITRWAGYDLDESVIENIRRMDWRPASRDGKTLPIRVLLRYNFKKIEKEEK